MDSTKTILEEANSVPLEAVKLLHTWSFWEQLQDRKATKEEKEANYHENLKNLLEFNDILAFYQFWSNYPAGKHLNNVFFEGKTFK